MKFDVLVRLKVSDNTAFSAERALFALGMDVKITRAEWYEVTTSMSKEQVEQLWDSTDVLANVNKHVVEVVEQVKGLIVWNKENEGSELLRMLKKRFGVHEISNIRKGVCWQVEGGDLAEAAKALLVCLHFQEMMIRK